VSTEIHDDVHEIKDAVLAIRDQLGQNAQQSSVEISTSTRGTDIKVKCYVGSPVREAGDAAIVEYVRVFNEIQSQLMKDFAAQVKR